MAPPDTLARAMAGVVFEPVIDIIERLFPLVNPDPPLTISMNGTLDVDVYVGVT